MAPTLDKVTFWGRTRGTRVADDHFLLLTQRVLEAQSLRKRGRDASHFLLLVFYSWSSPKWGEAGWLCQGQNISPNTIYNSTCPVRWDLSHYASFASPLHQSWLHLRWRRWRLCSSSCSLWPGKNLGAPLPTVTRAEWFTSVSILFVFVFSFKTNTHKKKNMYDVSLFSVTIAEWFSFTFPVCGLQNSLGFGYYWLLKQIFLVVAINHDLLICVSWLVMKFTRQKPWTVHIHFKHKKNIWRWLCPQWKSMILIAAIAKVPSLSSFVAKFHL